MDVLNVESSEVLFSARVKSFPDGSREVLVCDCPIFKSQGWEDCASKFPRKGDRKPRDRLDGEDVGGDLSGRARRRARAQVRELAKANPFRYFVTLTLDKERIDRYDMGSIVKKLNTWLDNNVRRRGLAYVLVPERHKDGAVHFHGLFNDALPVVDSGHVDKGGHTVYNLPRWGFGFSTAIRLYGEYDRAVSYVCKYIGKQGEKIGGRWFYSGGALARPEVTFADLSIRDALEMPGAYQFDIPEAGRSFVQFTVPVEEGGETGER